MEVNRPPPGDSNYEYFKSIPWCNEHLQDPKVVVETPICRVRKPSTEDELFATTLSTERTIPAFLMFYERPSKPGERVDEVKAFLRLEEGINGFPNTSHGGIVIAILDEIMGLLGQVNRKLGGVPDKDQMTAFLNTKFLQPVRTPGVILVTGRLQKFEGRKLFMESAIWDKDSNKLAQGEALFVILKPKI